MIIQFQIDDKILNADLSKPIDISIPLKNGADNPICFNAPLPVFEPVTAGDFIGSIEAGSPVNFYNIRINPHGNGTHTECVAHISKQPLTINRSLSAFHFIALLLTVQPQKAGTDECITDLMLETAFRTANTTEFDFEGLIIRTQPNDESKKSRNYSGSNPPYLTKEAMEWIVSKKIDHLLVDLPSVDPEEDAGALTAHKLFWNYPETPREQATITELVFVPDVIPDGLYLLNLQISPLELDASPSKPVLYKLY